MKTFEPCTVTKLERNGVIINLFQIIFYNNIYNLIEKLTWKLSILQVVSHFLGQPFSTFLHLQEKDFNLMN
jgi:hypothetical protein